jgi:hypothetical protein
LSVISAVWQINSPPNSKKSQSSPKKFHLIKNLRTRTFFQPIQIICPGDLPNLKPTISLPKIALRKLVTNLSKPTIFKSNQFKAKKKKKKVESLFNRGRF